MKKHTMGNIDKRTGTIDKSNIQWGTSTRAASIRGASIRGRKEKFLSRHFCATRTIPVKFFFDCQFSFVFQEGLYSARRVVSSNINFRRIALLESQFQISSLMRFFKSQVKLYLFTAGTRSTKG